MGVSDTLIGIAAGVITRAGPDAAQEHLTSVLRQCYSSNANGMHEMIEGLNEMEKGILRGVLTV